MGSGDLNMKKSWHPQRSGNVAATHKAEAEAIAERKKLQQRLQEIEEERRKEEIQKALEAAGGKPPTTEGGMDVLWTDRRPGGRCRRKRGLPPRQAAHRQASPGQRGEEAAEAA